MATKTANPGEKIITDNTNLGKIKDTQDKTFKTMSNDSLDLGDGLILSKTDPKYTSLIGKGFTDEQIIKAIGKMDASKIEGVTQKPVETAPKQVETQVEPQTEIKPATQEIKAEPTPAKVEKGPQLLPQSDYLDDSEARQQGIIANLNQAIQTNPQSLKDQKSFREYYNYVGRSDLQKKTLDTWYKGYQKGQELAYKDTNDIYKAYDSGNLSSGDLSNLKIVNPAKYNEVNALIDKKNKLATYSQDLYGVTEQANPFQAIIDNYTKGLQTLATSNFYNDYKEAMNSAGIKEQKLAIADKQTELDKIDKQINEKKREVEKRYEGTGATRGKINAIIADETEDLYSMRSNLVIDMNGAISKYNAESGAIREDFEMRQAEQQYNMQIRQQQMSELGFAMQLMSYETPAQQDERAWNTFIRQQEYTNGNIYSSDPKTRLRAIEKAVDNTLAEFAGIPMVRSRDQMVNDIKNLVEGGMDLGDAITENLRKPIMNKPEYKKWVNDKFGIDTSKNLVNIGGVDYLMDDQGNFSLPTLPGVGIDLGFIKAGDLSGLASQYPGEASFKNNNPAGLTMGVSNELKNLWKQAGINITQGTSRPAKEGGNYIKFDTIQDGLKAYDIAMTQRRGNATVKTYLNGWGTGTVGLPENILNKKVKDLSAEEKKTVQNAQIKKESPGLYNYLQQQGQGVTQIGQSSIVESGLFDATFETYFEQQKKITSLGTEKDRQAIFASMGINSYTDFQRLANERKSNKPADQRTLQLLAKLDNLEKGVKTFGPRSLEVGVNPDLKADYNFIKNNLSLESLQDAKAKGATFGALSDAEWKILGEAATALSPRLSSDKFQAEIQNIRNQIYENYPSLRTQGTQSVGYTFTVPTISGTGNTFTLSNGQTITW